MLPLLAWATGAAFFFYAWVLRVAPSVIVEDLMREFAVGGAVLGNLSALYFYGYSGMQLPVGVLLDRFGPRRLMTVAALVCAGGCVLFAQSPTLWGVGLGRFLIGASAAFSLVGAMAIAGQWFPARRFALLSGLAMMTGMAGGVFGQAPVSLSVAEYGWIAIAAWLTVRDKRAGPVGSSPRIWSGLKTALSNRQTWYNAISGLGATGPILAFAGLWGVPFLTLAYDLERTSAAAVASLMIVGFGVGAPLTGWLSDRIGRRRPPLVAGLALCLMALAVLIHVTTLPIWAVGCLCFLTGFGGSAQIVNFAAARESNPVAVSGTTIGVVNGLVTGGGALFQPLIGWLLDVAWSGGIAEGLPVYALADYQFALSALLVGTTIGLGCAVAMRETYCRAFDSA